MTTKKKSEIKVTKNSIIDMDKFVDYVYNRTVEWGKKYGMYPKGEDKKDKEFSEKAKNIVELIKKSDFGCQKENVRLLLEEVIGEKLPQLNVKNESFSFTKNICLFLISNFGGKMDNNVPFGEVVYFFAENSTLAMSKENKSFVLLASNVDKYCRIPTKNEIADFFEQLGEENLQKILF